MTCGKHQRVVGLLAVVGQNLFGDYRCRRGEVDAVEVILGDAVAGDDEQIAGADRHLVGQKCWGMR